MNTATAAKQALENKIAAIAGAPVELTIRADRAFTFSFESRNDAAAAKVAAFFKGQATVSVEHDDECGSFVYVDAI